MIKTMCLDDPELLARPTRVTTSRFEPDWNDLAGATSLRAEGDARRSLAGCWYWNPRFTVHCCRPTRAFFKKVRQCQADWYRTMGRVLKSASSRRQERNTASDPVRRLTFGGLLIVNGDIIDAKRWSLLEASLGLRSDTNVVVTRRPVDLNDLARPERCAILKRITLSELRRHMTIAPAVPAYVTPGITVTGTELDAALLAEVHKRNGEWHRRLNRKLGKCYRKRLTRRADLATKMLIYHGVLVVDGLFYRPGCWPNLPDSNRRATACADRLSTVSPEVLGLEPSETNSACPPTSRVDDDESVRQIQLQCSPKPGGTT